MKAYKIEIPAGTISLPNGSKASFAEIAEAIILNSPPGGLATDALIRTCDLYGQFKAELAKIDKQKSGENGWSWWLNATDRQTLVEQVRGMRWVSLDPVDRVALVGFVKGIIDSTEQDVPVAPNP